MNIRSHFAIALSAVFLATGYASANTTAGQGASGPSQDAAATASSSAEDEGIVRAISDRLQRAPLSSDAREQKDAEALRDFYSSRRGPPLWITNGRLNEASKVLLGEIADAGDFGLEASAFRVPRIVDGALDITPADAEIQISRAALLYARHARGGRIAEPAEMLNSNLDRKPQWIEPSAVLEGLAAASDKAAFLRSLHPKHPQFELLRKAFLAARPAGDKGPLSLQAKRLRANMEMWRWMWDDLGELHVFNNIPEFMQRVYLNGEIIRSEKIVAGMIDKQSSVFSRPLKYVVLRPTWRVPESIKVHELWPSLIRGGGLMRQYGLQLQTKAGDPLDWRKIDWSKSDIRDFEVIQPPGPKSVLGHVKFSFPSQHTIFMHDTPDKWMFRSAQRTLSHGCLRVQKPMELAEIILKADKGWDAAKIAELNRSGPLNNEVEIDKRIPIHLAYFTAWADDDGTVKMFRDVYGHEKRVTQALDGAWDKINKGRDHLAPVQPGFNPAAVARTVPNAGKQHESTVGDMIGGALGLSF